MRIAWSEVPWRSRGVLRRTTADVLVCTDGPGGFWWQQPVAGLARDLSMVVAAGGPPGGGVCVLTAMSSDVTAATVIALATPADARRRGACLVEIAPHGRASDERLTLVATDLSAAELEHHRAELAARVPALGLSADRVVVACADGRLQVGLDGGSVVDPEITPTALVFEV